MLSVCIGIHVYTEPQRLAATVSALRANTPAGVTLLLLPDGPDDEMCQMLAGYRDIPQAGSPRRMGRAQRNPSSDGGKMGFSYHLYPSYSKQ
ncbi:MAG: hypothetical protein U1F76_29425 [Candidatus Competibacteraceae bacterium]